MRGTLLTGKTAEDVVREAVASFNGEVPAGTPDLWKSESLERLTARYGENHVSKVLATTKYFLSEDPWTSRALLRSGFGNHPAVVLALVEAAMEST